MPVLPTVPVLWQVVIITILTLLIGLGGWISMRIPKGIRKSATGSVNLLGVGMFLGGWAGVMTCILFLFPS